MTSKKRGNSVYEHLASGASSGLSTTLVLQPLDLVKTRVQQSNGGNGRPRGAFSIAREIIAKDGPFGLWRGTAPSLTRNVPGVALYFYTLQSLRKQLALVPAFATASKNSSGGDGSTLTKLSSQGNLVAGGVARTSVGFLLNPFSVLKARYESSRYAYGSMTEAFRSIFRESGPRGLLQGFNASVLRDAPFAGIYVLFYELIKEQSGVLLGPRIPWAQTFIYTWSGAMAGALATLSTHPFDVMKTRMQVQSDDAQYRSLRRTIAGIFKERGVRGFFDGASIRVSRKIFSSAISWTVYETLLIFWRDRA